MSGVHLASLGQTFLTDFGAPPLAGVSAHLFQKETSQKNTVLANCACVPVVVVVATDVVVVVVVVVVLVVLVILVVLVVLVITPLALRLAPGSFSFRR